ncbi:hypothetical protein TOTORO_00070 [Serratia phage vB_SmaS-Totoro]|nr:hypothetical protein TOTORO_00070 [Serratia phage vB_SmaS-Totoro]
MNAYDVLAQRAVGELPISIGTSLAIEALANKAGTTGVGGKEYSDRYGALWINIRTLYRNIYESVENTKRSLLTPEAIASTLIEEVQYIQRFASGKIEHLQLYHREYADLLRRFPKAFIRVPNTPFQKQYDAFMNKTIDLVLARDDSQSIEWDKGSELRGEPTKALIITNYPVDLLSRTKFTQLRLLESHTGTIKSKSQWNSKLTEGKNLKMMPFNEFTIQVFGDGPTQFLRMPIAIRRAVIDTAIKYKWSPMTTMEKIRQNIQWIPDRSIVETLREALK